jgi:carbonic anhydrase
MKKLGITFLSIFTAVNTWAAEGSDWGYQDEKSPEYWASLNQNYHACLGHNQSPINIDKTVSGNLESIQFNYQNLDIKNIQNLPHTIQLNFNAGSSIEVDEDVFELKQIHFHSPSENTIGGKYSPLEAHFVHANKKNELAVLAVLYNEGNKNNAIQQLINNTPQQGQTVRLSSAINVNALLPESKAYYRFNGSLTTPPCTEGVRWFVLKENMTLSESEVLELQQKMVFPNNRPIQKQNARLVME